MIHDEMAHDCDALIRAHSIRVSSYLHPYSSILCMRQLDVMNHFFEFCLFVLHAVQLVRTCIIALLYQPFVTNPLALDAQRSKIPRSLALILSTTSTDPADDEVEKAIESVACAARCCMKAGIECLSVYDKHGALPLSASVLCSSVSARNCSQIF